MYIFTIGSRHSLGLGKVYILEKGPSVQDMHLASNLRQTNGKGVNHTLSSNQYHRECVNAGT
jgi:hypothetical protein